MPQSRIRCHNGDDPKCRSNKGTCEPYRPRMYDWTINFHEYPSTTPAIFLCYSHSLIISNYTQIVTLNSLTLWSLEQVATTYEPSSVAYLSLNLILLTASQWLQYTGTWYTLVHILSLQSQKSKSPVSRPTTNPYYVPLCKVGRNLIAVALGFSSGSSEKSSPILVPFPCQTLTDFCFSLEAVAKKASSCDQEMPQIIRVWASFTFLRMVNCKRSGAFLLNKAQLLSLEHDSRYWSHLENSSCTTVRLCAASLQDGTDVCPLLRSQIMMSAYFFSLALLALAAQSPLWLVAMQKTSKACPYSFCCSGHSVLLIKASSTGGSAKSSIISSALSFVLLRILLGSKSGPIPPPSSSSTRWFWFARTRTGLFMRPRGCFLTSDPIIYSIYYMHRRSRAALEAYINDDLQRSTPPPQPCAHGFLTKYYFDCSIRYIYLQGS